MKVYLLYLCMLRSILLHRLELSLRVIQYLFAVGFCLVASMLVEGIKVEDIIIIDYELKNENNF